MLVQTSDKYWTIVYEMDLNDIEVDLSEDHLSQDEFDSLAEYCSRQHELELLPPLPPPPPPPTPIRKRKSRALNALKGYNKEGIHYYEFKRTRFRKCK